MVLNVSAISNWSSTFYHCMILAIKWWIENFDVTNGLIKIIKKVDMACQLRKKKSNLNSDNIPSLQLVHGYPPEGPNLTNPTQAEAFTVPPWSKIRPTELFLPLNFFLLNWYLSLSLSLYIYIYIYMVLSLNVYGGTGVRSWKKFTFWRKSTIVFVD